MNSPLKVLVPVSAAIVVFAAGRCSASSPEWADDLWLGRDGAWTSRVPVVVSNLSHEAWNLSVVGVPAGGSPAGVPSRALGKDLRIVDGDGRERLYALRDGIVEFPVSCPAGEGRTFYLYYGNEAAWALADGWKRSGAAAKGAAIFCSKPESLRLSRIGDDAPLPSERWDYRVPLVSVNCSDTDFGETVGSVRLAEVLHVHTNAAYRLTCGRTPVATAEAGDSLFFVFRSPPRSRTCLYLYVDTDASGGKAPETPLSHVLSRVNLLENPSFEKGETAASAWDAVGSSPAGVSRSVVTGPSPGGRRHLELSVPSSVSAAWRGWKQTVKTVPGRRYVFGATVRGRDLSRPSAVHAHLHRAGGKTRFLKSDSSVAGTAGWNTLFASFASEADARSFSVFLTSDAKGRLSYDDAFVAECRPVSVGDIENAPLRSGDIVRCAVDPLEKVFPDTPVADASTLTVALARNESEPLQIAFRCRPGCKEVTAAVSPPRNAAGEELSVEAGRVMYVPIDHPSANDVSPAAPGVLPRPVRRPTGLRWSGWWPDPIVPDTVWRRPGNATWVLYLTVTAPEAAAAGTYTGDIVWKIDGAVARRDRYEAVVWNFALPRKPGFTAVFDLRAGRRWQLEGEDAAAMRRRMYRFAARKKICPDRIPEEVVFRRGADGRITADFSRYDKAAGEYFDGMGFPTSYTPNSLYVFGWAFAPRPFMGEKPYEGEPPYTGVDRGKLRPAYVQAYSQAMKLYWDHVREKGWAGRIVHYLCDEPHLKRPEIRRQVRALCDMIHAVDRSIPVYVSSWWHCADWDGAVDVWGADCAGRFPPGKLRSVVASGKRLRYTVDGSFRIDSPRCVQERMLPVYGFVWNAEAYEMWSWTWTTVDPWKFGWHSFISEGYTPGRPRSIRYACGDGYQAYPPAPGLSGDVATSVRLEAIRDGVESHDYLQLVSRLAKTRTDGVGREAADVLEEAARMCPVDSGRPGMRRPQAGELSGLRRRIGELLHRAAGGTR